MIPGLLTTAIQPDQRPNVVLFIVDDLGWQDLSIPLHTEPTEFNKRYQTPHLAELAKNSMIYTRAYSASPVCTPTRTSIMTGKNPARTHISYWTLQGDTSANDPKTKPPAWQMEGLLPKDGPFLPQILSDYGYKTIHVGKAHFGAIGKYAADPKAIGFQVNIAGHAAGGPGSFYGTHNFSTSLRQGKPSEPSVWDIPGLEEFHGKDIYLTEALTQKACDVIRESKGDGKPFFMNFAPYAVHAPIMANKRYLSKYAGLDQREAAYATMIESYDAAIGDLVSTLQATGEYDNTVFIFTSDNGGLSVHSRAGKDDRNAPLRGGKGSIYDGGIRIPLIVHRPGKPAGRTDNRVVSMDLFPSILGYAGINSVDSVDGRRIEVEGDRPLLFHMPHFWGVNAPGIEPFTSLIWGRYKLTYTHRDLGYQLYDLQSDIGEQKNIIGSASRDLKIKMIGAMSRELQRMNAQMPISKETGEPIPMPRTQWSSN